VFEIIRNAVVMGVFVFLPVLMVGSLRWRGVWALIVAIIAAVVGGALGILVPTDLFRLPMDTGLAVPVALVVGQALLGVVAGAAGRPWLPGPPVLVAPIAGALLGEIGGAALVTVGVEDPKARARLALGAAAGGLLGRMGDPALLISGGGMVTLAHFAPLALVAMIAARPRYGDLAGTESGSKNITAVVGIAAVLALVPALRLVAVFGGVLVLAGMAGRRLKTARPGPFLWVASGAALVLMATAGGAPALLGVGLESVQNAYMSLVVPVLLVGGALGSTMAGGGPAALFAHALLERCQALHVHGAHLALTIGVAAGGLGPLVVARAVGAGWPRWLLQVALILAVSAALL
jgi:hypothetical protein